MRQGAPTRLTATCCGLAAFAIAIVAGLAADIPADAILARALTAMFLCWIAGAILGLIGERAIEDHLQNLRDIDDSSARAEEPETRDASSVAGSSAAQPNVAA